MLNVTSSTSDRQLQAGIAAHRAGQFEQAERIFREILAAQNTHVDAWINLGRLNESTGKLAEALACYREALVAHPRSTAALAALATALELSGSLDDALACRTKALEIEPSKEHHYHLGNILLRRRKLDDAIAAYHEALRLDPDYHDARANLGSAFLLARRHEEARAALEAVLEKLPTFGTVHNTLGMLNREEDRLDESLDSFARAVELRPDSAFFLNNLASALLQAGKIPEALAAYERAFAASGNIIIHSDLLFNLHFDPALDAATIGQRHREFDRLHAQPLRPLMRPHANDRDPHRRLRVGYVSPDFRSHCVSFFTLPLLRHHNHADVEIFLYSSTAPADEVTTQHQQLADHWRDVTGQSNAQLAELIRADRIDILIDLSMHMSGSRLQLFALKPAPVQACWLAYPGTTGLSTMDYRITDPYLDPPQQKPAVSGGGDGAGQCAPIYSETSIHLPHTYWCYDPPEKDFPITPLPALENGHITFGCLNKFCKITPHVLQLWTRVLDAVPNSRMMIMSPQGRQRDEALRHFTDAGIDPARILLITKQPRRAYFELYHQIDICLDTFPYNGHTTSLDAFWMGVPIVTLVGNTVVGRGGLSQCTNLGLPELIAHTEADYIQIAATLANNPPHLSHLRTTLRERLQKSPLMNAPQFARDMETVFRTMWQTWCESPRQDSPTA